MTIFLQIFYCIFLTPILLFPTSLTMNLRLFEYNIWYYSPKYEWRSLILYNRSSSIIILILFINNGRRSYTLKFMFHTWNIWHYGKPTSFRIDLKTEFFGGERVPCEGEYTFMEINSLKEIYIYRGN